MTAVLATYCPHCRMVTNLKLSIVPRIVSEPEGEKAIISRRYHCESCRLFVRCEETN